MVNNAIEELRIKTHWELHEFQNKMADIWVDFF